MTAQLQTPVRLAFAGLVVGLAATAATASPGEAATLGKPPERDPSPVFVDVRAEPVDPYEHERVILRTRVYAGPRVLEGALTDPEIAGAAIERVGEDQTFREEIDGQLHRGVERTYALYPEAAGELEVPAITFQGVLREPAPRPSLGSRAAPLGPGMGADWFDDFFSGRMAAGDLIDRFFDRATRRVTVRSSPLTLHVRPPPEAAAGNWWLPARALVLEESWDPEPAEIRVGEALTRRVSLHGAGVGGAQLPPLPLPDLPNAKQYREAPRDTETEVGVSRIQEITVIPTESGRLTLPRVEIPWWDTESHVLRTASLEARTIEVLPAAKAAAVGEADASDKPATSSMAAPANSAPGQTAAGIFPSLAAWQWGGLVAGLGVAVGTFWCTRRRQHRSPAPDPAAAERALRRACRRSDAVSAENALREIVFARTPKGRTVDVNRWVSKFGGSELAGALASLHHVRYSNAAASWEGESLWKHYRAARRAAPRDRRHALGSAALPPLYPSATAERGAQGIH